MAEGWRSEVQAKSWLRWGPGRGTTKQTLDGGCRTKKQGQGLKVMRQIKSSFSRSRGIERMKNMFSGDARYVGRNRSCRESRS